MVSTNLNLLSLSLIKPGLPVFALYSHLDYQVMHLLIKQHYLVPGFPHTCASSIEADQSL